MMREPMAPAQPAAAMAPSARLAASHGALANYLRGSGGSTANGHTQGAQGTKGPAGDPAATPPINANLALVLANSALAPLARDHPWALVCGAAAAGALLAARPWRKVLQPLLVAGMVSPVVTRWAAHALTQNLARRWLGPDPGQPR